MKNKIKNLECYREVFVSIAYFLYNYCGLSDERTHSMTHNDLKKLMPELERVSFDEAIYNPDMVYSGGIILVRDSKHNVVPYISPFKEITDVKEIYSDEGISKKPRRIRPLRTIVDVKSLSNYELRINLKLQKDAQVSGKYKMCRLIKNEMNSRGIKSSGRKRRLIEKERGKEND